jgi:hypothetical protein
LFAEQAWARFSAGASAAAAATVDAAVSLVPGSAAYACASGGCGAVGWGLASLDVAGPAGKALGTAGKAGGVAKSGLSKADGVIAETLSGKGNFTSGSTLSANELLTAGGKFVGPGYSEIGKQGSGVFRSADGTRQFRIDNNSLTGSHAPGVPHGHLEVYKQGASKPSANNHIPFTE